MLYSLNLSRTTRIVYMIAFKFVKNIAMNSYSFSYKVLHMIKMGNMICRIQILGDSFNMPHAWKEMIKIINKGLTLLLSFCVGKIKEITKHLSCLRIVILHFHVHLKTFKESICVFLYIGNLVNLNVTLSSLAYN